MAVQTSYPGVYIEEFAPGAPIEGVGTSTAAFIGIAARGPLDEPTKLTSWDQFRLTYGDEPVPGFFLWYAVRGYFENGGQVCYVVRASNGDYAEWEIADDNGNAVLLLRARQPGARVATDTVTVTRVSRLPSATTFLFQPTAAFGGGGIAGREITIGGANAAEDAGQFRPGDEISFGTSTDRYRVMRVSDDVIQVDRDVIGAASSPVHMAAAPVGTRTIRIQSTAGTGVLPPGALVPGTILTIAPGGTGDTQVVESVQVEHLPSGDTTYRVTLRQGLDIALDLTGPATALQSEEFTIAISIGGSVTTYSELSLDAAHPRHVLRTINTDAAGPVRAELFEPPPPDALPDLLPAAGAVAPTTLGANEDLTNLGAADFIDALDTLERIDDVNLVSAPDCLSDDTITATVQQAVIQHCELLADRFAVLDALPGLDLFGTDSITAQRAGLDSTRGYAALYYPWLRVRPAVGGALVLVPPSGHVCGIIARSDLSRGVHKAPANEIVNGALGIEQPMSDVEQGQLNLVGINVIRVFAGGARPVLWGARTTATDRNWQYVNIRRLFLFLEESIEEGIRWAVFEPNNLALWQKLKRSIGAFLLRVWRDGALFGATPEEAFYVRIDEVLNPFSEQALGRLYIEIGVRPSYPAEFIIVRIGIWQGGAEITEG